MTENTNAAAASGRKKASEGGGIVWCYGVGTACVVGTLDGGDAAPRFLSPFARAQSDSPVYDPDLDDLAVSLNDLVRSAYARGRANSPSTDSQDSVPDGSLAIGMLATGSGFLPVWKREVTDSERLSDLVDVDTLTDLDAMTPVQRDEYLGVRGGEKTAYSGVWYSYRLDGGLITCVRGGYACYVTAVVEPNVPLESNYFPQVAEGSPVYDAWLDEAAAAMNSLLNQVQDRGRGKPRRDPMAQIGLVITGMGLLPAWKVVITNDDYVPAEGSIDLDSMTGLQRDEILRLRA